MNEPIDHNGFRNVLSLKKRVQIIKEYELYYPKPKILSLAAKFNVGCSQIRNILFNQEAILKAYEEASEKNKKIAADKVIEKNKKDISITKRPENTESGEDNNLNVLSSITDRKKIIHDYSYKSLKPTIGSLATKYNMSPRGISNALLSQESVVESYNKPAYNIYTEGETVEQSHNQREDQIKFLGMVMYEYLQRALFNNEPVDDLKFQKKAAEVKECITIAKFTPSYLWLNGFKKKYGIDNLDLESLRNKIVFTEKKHGSLEAVDMVRFVRQHKNALQKAESELTERLANSAQCKNLVFNDNNVDGIRSKKAKLTPQLRKNYTPKIVYERVDGKVVKSLGATKSQTDVAVNGPAIIKGSPLTHTAHRIEEKILAIQSTNKIQKAHTALENVKQQSSRPDISCITALEWRPTVRKVLNQKNEPQHISKNMPALHLSKENEFLTNFEIVDNEAPESFAAYNNQSFGPPFSCIDKYSQESDLSGNNSDGITIKTEPQSIEEIDVEMLGVGNKQNSTFILPDHSQQLCLTANDCEEMIIEDEICSLHFDEDIKPTIIFEMPNEFEMENNICTNGNLLSPRLVIGNRPHSNSPLPEVLDEDIKPTIIFGSSGEFVIENTKSRKDQHHSPRLTTDKRTGSNSPPSEVLDEDIKPTIVCESSEELVIKNTNSANDEQHSTRLAIDKRRYSNLTLPDIDTPEDAMVLLKVLEKYAVLKDNHTAIGLLTHLVKAFDKQPK